MFLVIGTHVAKAVCPSTHFAKDELELLNFPLQDSPDHQDYRQLFYQTELHPQLQKFLKVSTCFNSFMEPI